MPQKPLHRYRTRLILATLTLSLTITTLTLLFAFHQLRQARTPPSSPILEPPPSSSSPLQIQKLHQLLVPPHLLTSPIPTATLNTRNQLSTPSTERR